MAITFLSPLSACNAATFPQVLEPGAVPKPILESQLLQSFWSLPRMPILALGRTADGVRALNPSLLQFSCKEPLEPRSDFHASRPSDVLRYSPSPINECKDSAVLLIKINFNSSPFFIPRQILVKFVFQ